MGEFKLDKSIKAEVNVLKNSANAINKRKKQIDPDGIKQMPTAKKYYDQLKECESVFNQYRDLLIKDVDEINTIVDLVIEKDNKISNMYK